MAGEPGVAEGAVPSMEIDRLDARGLRPDVSRKSLHVAKRSETCLREPGAVSGKPVDASTGSVPLSGRSLDASRQTFPSEVDVASVSGSSLEVSSSLVATSRLSIPALFCSPYGETIFVGASAA